MKTLDYVQKNKWNLIFLAILLLTKSIFQLFDFPTSNWLLIIRIGIFIAAIILSLIIIRTWKFKLLTIGLIIIFSLGQGLLKLWKIPAKKYVFELYKDHDKPINIVLRNDSIRTIDYRPVDGLIITFGQKYEVDSILFSDSDRQLITQLLKTTEIIEIEKNQFGTLFIMSRFLDNGYGLFFATQEQIEMINKTKRFNINGYDVTGFSKIWDNWYYLAFT